MLGLLGRAGVGEVPEQLTATPSIVSVAVMFAVEFVADKVPLDSLWDVIQTPIRPAMAADRLLFAAEADVPDR